MLSVLSEQAVFFKGTFELKSDIDLKKREREHRATGVQLGGFSTKRTLSCKEFPALLGPQPIIFPFKK